MKRAANVLPIALIVALAATWTWWAIRRGAYFPDVFLPGAAVLTLLLTALLVLGGWPARLRGAVAVALAALLALMIWTAVSALWSPASATAVEDAQRVFLYVLAFAVGLWSCLLLRRRLVFSLVPLVVAGAIAAVVTAVGILGAADPASYLDVDQTLELPFGYRNANAAFFAIVFLAAVGLAASDTGGALVRAGCAATAALALQLAVVSQSRGSVVAFAVALLVLLALARLPGRTALVLVAAAAPAVAALPWLLDPFTAQTASAAGEALQGSMRAALVATLVAALLGAASVWAERRARLRALRRRLPRRSIVLVAFAVLALAGGGFALSRIDVADTLESFGGGGTPSFDEEGSRFSLDAGSNRRDFWRAGVDAFAEQPLTGQGAGGFHAFYLRERTSHETPRDPHSIELLMLSELGGPGLVLFATFAVAACVAVLRSRRLGPAAADLSVVALAIGAYWLTQASIDWFWEYAGVTAPVIALLGAAAAPALVHPVEGGIRAARAGVALLVALLAATLVPTYVSDRWLAQAYDGWNDALAGAYDDLDRARTANPLAVEPWIAEGVIAREAGERKRALEAFREAVELEPENWAAHYFLGETLSSQDPEAAVEALERAHELNPRDERAERALRRARRQT